MYSDSGLGPQDRPLLQLPAAPVPTLPGRFRSGDPQGGAQHALRGLVEHAQGVRLCVEHPVGQVHGAGGVEEEEEVLHGLRHEEGLHAVVLPAARVQHVRDVRVGRGRPGPPFKGLEDGPPVVAVLRPPSEVVQQEERLQGLGPQNVELGLGRHCEVHPGGRVEVDVLGAQARGLPSVHLHTRLGERLGHRHVLLGARHAVLRTQREHARGEAHEVVHLVHVPLMVLRDVHQAPGRPEGEVVQHAVHGLLVELFEPRLLLACVEPLLEKVLVVGVTEGAQGDHLVAQGARVGVQEGGHQTVHLGQPLQDAHLPQGRLGVARVASARAERLVLELDGPVLRQDGGLGAPGGEGAGVGAEVEVGAGDPGLGLEGPQEHVPELLGLVQEGPLPREVVGAEQAAQRADGRLEHGDPQGGVEAQVGGDPVARLVKVFLEAHDPQSVQRVHHGGCLAQPVPGGVALGLDLVLAPGVLLVPIPRVLEAPAHGLPALEGYPVARLDLLRRRQRRGVPLEAQARGREGRLGLWPRARFPHRCEARRAHVGVGAISHGHPRKTRVVRLVKVEPHGRRGQLLAGRAALHQEADVRGGEGLAPDGHLVQGPMEGVRAVRVLANR
mmetsp:Transcript_27578/g.92217  ORF Transcript_27578/g.92217 Transcript_27578/m.92217 type:complete len:612 (+) Transcript_27578:196-2031(+)